MPFPRRFLRCEKTNQSSRFPCEYPPKERIEKKRREREIRIPLPERLPSHPREKTQETNRPVEAHIAEGEEEFPHRLPPPQEAETLECIAAKVPEPLVMGAPQERIRWDHDEEVRAGLHGSHEFPNKLRVVPNVLEDIEEEDGIHNAESVRTVAGNAPTDEAALWEPLSGECNRIGIRINAHARVLPGECDGISPRPTANIDNARISARRKEPMEERTDDLPPPAEPPVHLFERCVRPELRQLHGTSIPEMLHLNAGRCSFGIHRASEGVASQV